MDLGKLLDYIPRIGNDGLTIQDLEEEFSQDLEQWKAVVAEETGIDTERMQQEGKLSELGYEVLTEPEIQRLNPNVREKISEFPMGYHPGSNQIIVNFPIMEKVVEQEGCIPVHFYGEEIAHWLREDLNPETYNLTAEDLMSLDRSQQEILIDTVEGTEYQPDFTVNEFFGRIGSRIVTDSAGEEPGEIPENPGTLIENEYAGTESLDEDLDEYRELLMNKDPQELRPGDPIGQMQQFIAHRAGYRAVDDQFESILEDDQIFYREDEEVREEYNLGEYETQALQEIMDDEVIESLEQ